MHAVSTNQIADILHFNDNVSYSPCNFLKTLKQLANRNVIESIKSYRACF